MMPFTEACCELLRIPLLRGWVNKVDERICP
jgi:hypothetical protein